MSRDCYLNTVGMLCAAGTGPAEIVARLSLPSDTLSRSAAYCTEGRTLPLGLYQGGLPDIELTEPYWQSRNNRFALAVLQQIMPTVQEAIHHYGRHRVGVVIGTSTSGVATNERAISCWVNDGKTPQGFDYRTQEMGAPSAFIAACLDIAGPVYSISTACSSGAKALATARRLLRAGICDAVIAGGVDTLCGLTVNGFSALESVSEQRCNPFSLNRNGINIGEGAALFVVSRKPRGALLAGVGEGSDAHHISAPDPSGAGARRVMQAALKDASLTARQIDYINVHGTATRLNDQMEARALGALFGDEVPCSSTKPFTGHTLGAAGAIEAGICWQLLQSAETVSIQLPLHLWDGQADPELPRLRWVDEHPVEYPRYVLSNSFAFGGNNVALILGRCDDTAI